MIIAVDGPAGAGKSTVCRQLAQRLGFVYLDTGAMYRAVAWSCVHQGLEPDRLQRDDPRLAALLRTVPLEFTVRDQGLVVVFDGRPLGDELRQPAVSRGASVVSRHQAVRDHLNRAQRCLAEGHDVVAEGRDSTTVVFPDAEVKIYLTADLATRARRRYLELRAKSISCRLDEIEKEIAQRDRADSQRELAPLRSAPDAVTIDTTGLSIDGVLRRIFELIDDRRKKALLER